ncbi:MAG TPA: hypothetical protein VFB45_21325 [Pseudolabrys sp.]|nr:hypothetical protein [Pseudolabrys sp.]
MHGIRIIAAAAAVMLCTAAVAGPAFAADDILDAIEQARKAYAAGDLSGAKQSLDLASQLVGQKNAERFAELLPEPLPGWKAEKAETAAVGAAMFGASSATRTYTDAKGSTVEVAITGDSAVLTQFAPLLNNPMLAGAIGKIVKIGEQRAIQTHEGDINMVIGNKYMVTVHGTANAEAKMAYAQAVNVAKLSKM